MESSSTSRFRSTINYTSDNTVNINIMASPAQPSLPMTATPSQTKESLSSTISHTSDNTVNINITASPLQPSLPMTATPSQTKESFSSIINYTSNNTLNINITASPTQPSLPMTATPSQTKKSFSDAKISSSSESRIATLAPYSTTPITTIMSTGISKVVTNECRFPSMTVSHTDTQSMVSRID